MRTVDVYGLKLFDVVTSPEFVNGYTECVGRYDIAQVGFATPCEGPNATNDPSRATARYVILEITEAGERAFGPPDSSWWEVTAQRLREDDTYDNKAEKIHFRAVGFQCGIETLTVVARMTLTLMPMGAPDARHRWIHGLTGESQVPKPAL